HSSLSRATYHPLDFNSSKLVPYREYIDQLKVDYNSNHQIIIVTARPQSSEKYVREYLNAQGIESMISHILYINDKTSFLKAINVVKHYDDSPKQFIPMRQAGLPVVAVDPPLNRF